VDSEKSADETLEHDITVLSPEYCSDVHGNTRITVSAPDCKKLTAHCWQAGGKYGQDSVVATITLDARGKGSFVFPANHYPHGPTTITITGYRNGTQRDDCYLQLYNTGGTVWNQGIPATPPPAATGMKLLFQDDFNTMPTISKDGTGATYCGHKPDLLDFSWPIPFADAAGKGNPFAQKDSYLRIRVDSNKNTAGIISSMRRDGTGVLATCPCYFECRFIGPNAIASWPAFWLMTKAGGVGGGPCDELDIIEAWGGEGPGMPDGDYHHRDSFQITPHAWSQGAEGDAAGQQAYRDIGSPIVMHKFGIPSSWYEASHIYGCKITPTDTIYYLDDVEVGRHKTLTCSKKDPLFFMVNLAVGCWMADLTRYHGKIDMYVDYVRVYQG
jgi:hypothetical protein